MVSNALEFIVPGKIASNNRTTRFFGGKPVKSKQANEYQQRVFQTAFATAQVEGWTFPEACAILIVAHNPRIDIDNIPKSVLDGMIGAVYEDDKIVNAITITRVLDNEGEKTHVTVFRAHPLVRPKKKKAATTELFEAARNA